MLSTNGTIEKPEDFVVEEVISPKFLRKYERSSGKVKPVEGPYSLFILRKRKMTTEEALKIVSSNINVPLNSIGYAGLKDKFAVTSQCITIKDKENGLDGFCQSEVSLEKTSRTNRHISIGDLLFNKFTITLHNCKSLDKIGQILSFIKKPIPNYFGPQRFSRNNAETGRKLLQRKINADKFSKEKAKFFVNAYQSHIFNKTLMVVKGKRLPLVGYNSKKIPKYMASLLAKDKISQKDFRFSGFLCAGSWRETFIKIQDFNYSTKDDSLKLCFSLPKGSYATIVLNKIQKGEWLCQ